MSSCISGGSRTYALDLEIIKSPTTSNRTSQTSSSPSSTISESSNSPLAICTRKPRAQRKRPNQTYNEAAALLSIAYPNIFWTNNLTTNPSKSTKYYQTFSDSPELLLPFRVADDNSGSELLLDHHQPMQDKPFSPVEPKLSSFFDKPCQSPGENEIQSKVSDFNPDSAALDDDFDAESILDEEIEEGIIDSIMGSRIVNDNNNSTESRDVLYGGQIYGNRTGKGFGGRMGVGLGGHRRGVSAWRAGEDVNWWNFPTVDVGEISPKLNHRAPSTVNSPEKKTKKKKKVVEKEEEKCLVGVEGKKSKLEEELPREEGEDRTATAKPGLLLKLKYEDVAEAWSGKGSPFSNDCDGVGGTDVSARLAQIDLFSEGGGVREASVQRYKEKRRTRLFSKKIRYQVRKVNADRRPRMKGRFVRRPNSSTAGQR